MTCFNIFLCCHKPDIRSPCQEFERIRKYQKTHTCFECDNYWAFQSNQHRGCPQLLSFCPIDLVIIHTRNVSSRESWIKYPKEELSDVKSIIVLLCCIPLQRQTRRFSMAPVKTVIVNASQRCLSFLHRSINRLTGIINFEMDKWNSVLLFVTG